MSQQDTKFIICATRMRYTITKSVLILWTMQPGFWFRNYMAHMNHLKRVTELFEVHQHGLTKNDIMRKDRQNWASAQRLTFLRVQNCLEQIVEGIDEIGRPPDPSHVGIVGLPSTSLVPCGNLF